MSIITNAVICFLLIQYPTTDTAIRNLGHDKWLHRSPAIKHFERGLVSQEAYRYQVILALLRVSPEIEVSNRADSLLGEYSYVEYPSNYTYNTAYEKVLLHIKPYRIICPFGYNVLDTMKEYFYKMFEDVNEFGADYWYLRGHLAYNRLSKTLVCLGFPREIMFHFYAVKRGLAQ
jgi:hypothetical protein